MVVRLAVGQKSLQQSNKISENNQNLENSYLIQIKSEKYE
jgi:hypothetical protein